MASINELYNIYNAKRDEIRTRQAVELEVELTPERTALREEVVKLRAQGFTILEIAEQLGFKNRTFIYKVLNDVPAAAPSRLRGRPRKNAQSAVVTTPSGSWRYEVAARTEEGIVSLWVMHEGDEPVSYKVQLDQDGLIVELPEAWYRDGMEDDERVFYRQLIKAIENDE